MFASRVLPPACICAAPRAGCSTFCILGKFIYIVWEHVVRADGHLKTECVFCVVCRTFGTLLQGASNDGGGSEEPIGNGLHSGHAYSINNIKKISTGEVLVQLRNPWGSCEWTGAWGDNDSRWTPAIARECRHTNKEDGMFWMSIDDFTKSFTTITFCDLVPSSFTVLRAEGEWTRKTGGGCANHKSWKLNPQLLMRVTRKSHIMISLNQPDSRMQFRTGELGKAEFDDLYGCGTGYADEIGFAVWKGGERKVAYTSRGQVGSASYSASRTVSVCISECDQGDYIIVPTTFDPTMMKFRMRFWSNNPIELIDTKGGADFKIFDASDDSISTQDAPLKGPREVVPEERAPPPLPGLSASSVQNVIVPEKGGTSSAGILGADLGVLGKGSWKVGESFPERWKVGKSLPTSLFPPPNPPPNIYSKLEYLTKHSMSKDISVFPRVVQPPFRIA